MNSAETIERVPIHTDVDGVVRVAGTRVTLDTIVGAFDAGATAEEIAQQYSSVPLADVYSVITYLPAAQVRGLRPSSAARGSPDNQRPFSWHPSGKFLAFRANRPGTFNDLVILPMEGDASRGWTPGTPTVFLSTPAAEAQPMFSDTTDAAYDLHPDGMRVAATVRPDQASVVVQDKVVFVFNFGAYLRTIAPGTK